MNLQRPRKYCEEECVSESERDIIEQGGAGSWRPRSASIRGNSSMLDASIALVSICSNALFLQKARIRTILRPAICAATSASGAATGQRAADFGAAVFGAASLAAPSTQSQTVLHRTPRWIRGADPRAFHREYPARTWAAALRWRGRWLWAPRRMRRLAIFSRRPVSGSIPSRTNAAARHSVVGAKVNKPAAPVRNDPIADLIAPSPRVLAIQRALSDSAMARSSRPAIRSGNPHAIEKFEPTGGCRYRPAFDRSCVS